MSYQKEKKVIHNIRTEVDSFGRKKYRLEEQVIESGQEEQNDEKKIKTVVDTGRHKSMLIGREEGLNIEKYIGKIDTNKKKKASEVFYCDICSEGFKCDIAYITHINSPAHNRRLGMNMKVKNVSLQTVSSKISQLINKKLEKRKQQYDDEEQQDIVRKLQGRDSGLTAARRGTINNHQTALEKEQHSDDDLQEVIFNNESVQQDADDERQQQQIKHQSDKVKLESAQQQQQQQQQQPEQDSNELAEQEMMLMMGIGVKKLKRR